MRTIMGTTWLQDMTVSNIMGIEYTPKEGSTLNEYLDISIDDKVGNPSISHYTLGISKLAADAFLDGIEHSPIDITLYEMIPLLLVDKDIRDLSSAEVEEYDLIKDIDVDGKTYIACYAKRIDSISNKTNIYDIQYDPLKEQYSVDLFKFTDDNLGKPTPKLGKDYVFDNGVPSVAVSSSLSIILSLQEVENVKEVLNILYPNSTEFITDRIFEVGIVASNGKDGYFQHTHYLKSNKFINSLTLESNNIAELDIGGMGPVNL